MPIKGNALKTSFQHFELQKNYNRAKCIVKFILIIVVTDFDKLQENLIFVGSQQFAPTIGREGVLTQATMMNSNGTIASLDPISILLDKKDVSLFCFMTLFFTWQVS